MKIVWGRSVGWNIDFNSNSMEYSVVTDGADCYPWREVYAWLPVRTVSGELVWREKVFKRKVWVVWGTGFHMEPKVQYATMFDLITYDPDSTFKN